MSRDALALALADGQLPALAQALNSRAMLPAVAGSLGVDAASSKLRCAIHVLSHKRGQRCTLHYEVTADAGRARRRWAATGKVYRRKQLAAQMFELINQLRRALEENAARDGIPQPLAVIDDLGLLLLEFAPGLNLRQVVPAPEGERAVKAAAAWLAALHVAARLAALPVTSLEHELEKLDGWCALVLPELPDATADRLERTRRGLYDAAAELAVNGASIIHKDFYHGNVVWDGRRVTALDFDQMSVGSPAFDVGHFCAHMESLTHRMPAATEALRRASARFLEAYSALSGRDVRAGLPFARGYTFLKLAATEVTRQESSWRRLVAAFSEAACREVE